MTRQGRDLNGDVLETVNRSAIVLEPTEKYLQWTRECPVGAPDISLDDLKEDVTVYLVPETDEEPEKILKRNYEAMFVNELFAWCTDEAFWPKDRSFKVFKEFFNARFCSMVLDMADEPIGRDD